MLNKDRERPVNVGFFIHATARVVYDGRAASELEYGDYVFIHKPDGTFMAMGSSRAVPLNYQPPKAKLYINGNQLICRSKKEELIVTIKKIHHIYKIEPWSDNRITLVRSEKDITRTLRANLKNLIPQIELIHVESEAKTEVGPIDLLCKDTNSIYHVFEVKRATITINSVVQLGKYVHALRETGKQVKGYVVAPRILDNAQKHADKNGVRFIQIAHEPNTETTATVTVS